MRGRRIGFACRRRAGLVIFATALGACADPLASDESCRTHRCVTAPPPLCEGTMKVVFQAVGTCSEDPAGALLCAYPIAQQQDCALLDDKLCRDGQCVAKEVVPCEGVVCITRPPPDCDGTLARIYGPTGTCNPDKPAGAQCEYPLEATLDCAQSGFACREGGCVDPADFPCDPNPCDVPPQGTCSGNVPTSIPAEGTCAEKTVDNRPVAECSYTPNAPGGACQPPKAECYLGACARALEAPSHAGDLVISEVNKNPTSLGDEAEWFEFSNPTDAARALDGCIVSDDGGESHTLGGGVIVPSLGQVVLGLSADPKPNGGFVPDYVYTGLVLANEADEIVVTCGGVVIDRVAWTASWPSGTGRAMTLAPGTDAAGNDAQGAWCDAPQPYGNGTNLGSPRQINPACPSL